MKSITCILDNIADHTKTLLRLLSDKMIATDVCERLRQHILFEEQENTLRLQEMQALTPSSIAQKLLDHSFLLQQMMQEDAMSDDLKRELLDHFIEEHQDWIAEMSLKINTRQWTVGPLWTKGG